MSGLTRTARQALDQLNRDGHVWANNGRTWTHAGTNGRTYRASVLWQLVEAGKAVPIRYTFGEPGPAQIHAGLKGVTLP